jgi:hypothetical protein
LPIVSHVPQYISPDPQQWPPLHVPVQTAPHAPQLFASVLSSTHLPLHKVVAFGHPAVHVPATQRSPLGHTLPHAPQFEGSLCVSLHVGAHLPLVHTSPLGQALPHAPQFVSLCVTSTQLPLQSVSPALHVSVHLPWLQTSPEGHAFAQLPQCFASEVVSTQSLPHCVLLLAHTAPSAPSWTSPPASGGAASPTSVLVAHAITRNVSPIATHADFPRAMRDTSTRHPERRSVRAALKEA